MAVLVFSLLGMGRLADAAEETEDGSILLRYSAVDEAKFQIFRVGDITEDNTLILTGKFQEIPIEGKNLDAEDMAVLSETLAAYAAADGINPDRAGRTEDGEVFFGGLEKGIYLVTGERVIQDGVQYDPAPFLTAVPMLNEEGEWLYQTEGEVKYETSTPTEEEIRYQVVKHWAGDQSGQTRPFRIQVDIIKDGELYETCFLSEENNWSCQWTAPDDGSTWQVVERNIPQGYTVKAQQSQKMFILTNTYTAGDLEDGPQTSDRTVFFPAVPLLSLSGIALILTAIVRRNRREA